MLLKDIPGQYYGRTADSNDIYVIMFPCLAVPKQVATLPFIFCSLKQHILSATAHIKEYCLDLEIDGKKLCSRRLAGTMESKHIYVTTLVTLVTLVTPTIPTPKHESDHPHFHSVSNSADNDNTTYPISA